MSALIFSFNELHKMLAVSSLLVGHGFAATSGLEGSPQLQHQLSLTLFDNQIGQSSSQSDTHIFPVAVPLEDSLSRVLRSLRRSVFLRVAREFAGEPINQSGVAVSHAQRSLTTGVDLTAGLFARDGSRSVNASLSIQDACKVGPFCLCHKVPCLMLQQHTTNKAKCTAATTKSSGTREGEAIVCSIGKPIEGDPKWSPRRASGPYGWFPESNSTRYLENQQPVFVGATERLQYCFQLSQDQLIRDAMAATTSVVNCVGGVNGQSPTELSLGDIQDVNTVLLRNKAMKFTSGIEGEDRFGTGPIAASYLGLGHTDLLNSLTNISQFIASHQYSNVTPVLPAEVGYCNYFRFCLSAEGLIEANASSTGQDVYDMFMVAREAVGDVELSGYGVQLIYSDPSVVEPRFRTASSLACKWSQAPTILNDAWLVRLRCTL